MQTYNEARALIPADASWTSSFGSPLYAGYAEYFRDDASGQRYCIVAHSDLFTAAEGPRWTIEPVGIGGHVLGTLHPQLGWWADTFGELIGWTFDNSAHRYLSEHGDRRAAQYDRIRKGPIERGGNCNRGH